MVYCFPPEVYGLRLVSCVVTRSCHSCKLVIIFFLQFNQSSSSRSSQPAAINIDYVTYIKMDKLRYCQSARITTGCGSSSRGHYRAREQNRVMTHATGKGSQRIGMRRRLRRRERERTRANSESHKKFTRA